MIKKYCINLISLFLTYCSLTTNCCDYVSTKRIINNLKSFLAFGTVEFKHMFCKLFFFLNCSAWKDVANKEVLFGTLSFCFYQELMCWGMCICPSIFVYLFMFLITTKYQIFIEIFMWVGRDERKKWLKFGKIRIMFWTTKIQNFQKSIFNVFLQ